MIDYTIEQLKEFQTEKPYHTKKLRPLFDISDVRFYGEEIEFNGYISGIGNGLQAERNFDVLEKKLKDKALIPLGEGIVLVLEKEGDKTKSAFYDIEQKKKRTHIELSEVSDLINNIAMKKIIENM